MKDRRIRFMACYGKGFFMPKIEFLPDNIIFDIDEEKTLLENALENGIPQAKACGGHGKCSTCRVWVIEGSENCQKRSENEEEMAKKLNFNDEIRLACQTKARGPLKLRRLIIDETDLEVCNKLTFKGDESSKVIRPVGEEKEIALMFTDIRGFTSFSEKHPPYDVLFLLNRHFHQLYKIVDKNNGMVDNYVGDSLFALFGMDNDTDFIFKAVKSGVEILKEVDNMKPYMESMYGEIFDIRIGIHYGKVVVGDIGPSEKSKTTVIGDNVNIASRIEAANKNADTRFLVSEVVYEKVKERVISDDFVRMKIPGKETKFTLYEINGLKETESSLEGGKSSSKSELVKGGVLYQKIIPSKDLPCNSQKQVSFNNEEILLINHENDIFALLGRCPHANMPIEGSEILKEKCQIRCKWHHATFDIKNGKVIQWCKDLPLQNQSKSSESKEKGVDIRSFPVVIEDDFIWVSLA